MLVSGIANRISARNTTLTTTKTVQQSVQETAICVGFASVIDESRTVQKSFKTWFVVKVTTKAKKIVTSICRVSQNGMYKLRFTMEMRKML